MNNLVISTLIGRYYTLIYVAYITGKQIIKSKA